MKCDECQALVQEYFDGELDRRTANALSAHVANCPGCSAALEQLTIEDRTYRQYDRQLEVSPALWAKIQAELPAENRVENVREFSGWQSNFGKLLSLRFSVAASAALVVLAVVATVFVMRYLNRPGTAEQLAVSSATPSAENKRPGGTEIADPAKPIKAEVHSEGPERKRSTGKGSKLELASRRSLPASESMLEQRTPAQLIREAEKKYLSAIALLTRDSRRQSRVDSETRVKLEGALAAIDRTILSTRKAVQRNPNDPQAVQYMLAAYGKKVDVLKEMGSYQ